jgi:hypothetical protein
MLIATRQASANDLHYGGANCREGDGKYSTATTAEVMHPTVAATVVHAKYKHCSVACPKEVLLEVHHASPSHEWSGMGNLQVSSTCTKV